MESGGRAGGMMASLPHSWHDSGAILFPCILCVTISTVPPGKSLGRTDHSCAHGIGEFQTGYVIFQKVYIYSRPILYHDTSRNMGWVYIPILDLLICYFVFLAHALCWCIDRGNLRMRYLPGHMCEIVKVQRLE